MVGVEQWAEIRRLHFVKRSVAARDPSADGAASRHDPQGARQRASRRSISARRRGRSSIRSRTRFTGCWARTRSCRASVSASCSSRWAARRRKTVVDDYLREVRPLFAPRPRTFQRTVYRPGEICQFDVWQPREEVPVGHGQTRRGWVVVACLGYSRAGAGVLVFSHADRGPVGGDRRLPGAPGRVAADAGLGPPGGHPRPRRPADARRSPLLRPAAGSTGISASRPIRRPRASSSACRATPRPTSSPAAPSPTSSTSRTSSTPGSRAVNARTHKTLRARPIDRLADELEAMAPLPERLPDTARRWTTRVPPDPHLRIDTNDYSLDPALVGRRVEVIVDQRTVTAACAGHRRGRLPPRARLRPPPDDHRARARPHPESRPRRSRGDAGRDPAAGPLRRADRMTRPSTELAHLFRRSKAPAAARALPKLADRARAEEWSL